MLGAVAKNTIKTTGLLGLRVVTQAISLVLLSRLLGVEMYGGFMAIATLAVVLGVIPNLGAGYLMMSLKVKRDDAVSYIWRFAWPLTFVIGLVLLCIYYLLTVTFFLNSSQSSYEVPHEIIFLLGFAEIVLMPFIILLSFALQSHNKVPLSQFIQWLPLLFKLVSIVICYYFIKESPLMSYVIFQFISVLLALFIAFFVVTHQVKLNWSPRFPRWGEISSGAKYASMGLSNFTSSEADKILVVNWLGNAEASIYSATSRVVSSLVMPITAMLLSAQPKLFRNAGCESKESSKLIKLLFGLTCLWGGISWLLLTMLAPYISIVFGEGFNEMATIMPLFAFISVPFALRRTAGVILVSMEKPLQKGGYELLGIIILVFLIMLLTPKIGISGLILSVIISETITAILSWLYIYKEAKKGSMDYLPVNIR